MSNIVAYGPIGVLLALGNVDAEFHGVRHRHFRSGKFVDGPNFRGEGRMSKFYINGKVCTRKDAIDRLGVFVKDGERIEISGKIQ